MAGVLWYAPASLSGKALRVSRPQEGLLFMDRPHRVGVRIPVAAEAGVPPLVGSSLAIEALRTTYYLLVAPRRAFGLPDSLGPIGLCDRGKAVCSERV